MHILTRILVYVPDAIYGSEDLSRSEIISAVREHAEQGTACYANLSFDWRETDTAGRWSSQYPENVILGSEQPNRLIRELTECREEQRDTVQTSMKLLGDYADLPLRELVDVLSGEGAKLRHAAYLLKIIADIQAGAYSFHSNFFNLHNYTARITAPLMEAVKNLPKDWALVAFDEHC